MNGSVAARSAVKIRESPSGNHQPLARVTVEEHQVTGGLGGAVAEYLSQTHPVIIERVGVQNQFGQSGKPKELIEHYGMGVSAIKKAVKKVIKRK